MHKTRRLLLVLSVLLAWAFAMPDALAKQFRFVGHHPIAKGGGGGYCYIEVPHVHVYAPVQGEVLYRDHDGWEYYAGDPVAYGYDGPKHAYHGAHPIYVDVAVADPDYVDHHNVAFCYIAGPHYHAYAPPPDVKFEIKGNVYWYLGDFPPEFVKLKPRYARINAVYRPIEYARPVVVVEPPPAYVDVLVAAPAVSAGAAVVTPGVRAGAGVRLDVEIPVPTVEVRVGGGVGVGVGGGWVRGSGHGHGHGKYKVKYKEKWKR